MTDRPIEPPLDAVGVVVPLDEGDMPTDVLMTRMRISLLRMVAVALRAEKGDYELVGGEDE